MDGYSLYQSFLGDYMHLMVVIWTMASFTNGEYYTAINSPSFFMAVLERDIRLKQAFNNYNLYIIR